MMLSHSLYEHRTHSKIPAFSTSFICFHLQRLTCFQLYDKSIFKVIALTSLIGSKWKQEMRCPGRTSFPRSQALNVHGEVAQSGATLRTPHGKHLSRALEPSQQGHWTPLHSPLLPPSPPHTLDCGSLSPAGSVFVLVVHSQA